MKLLGLIGGTSYHSTLEYYRLINEKVSLYLGKSQNPDLLLYSINIDVMRRQDIDEINQTYLKVSKALQEAGAKAIMICANTPHMAVEFVQPKMDIPILHIGDSVGEEAKKQTFKKLLLLGNKPTMTKDFLKKYLKDHYELDIRIPSESNIEKSHFFVSKELTQGVFSNEAKSFYKELIHEYEESIDAVILGCTELPILLRDEQAQTPFLSTTDLHIQTAVNFMTDN
ncbi:amino acid racemase [Psychroflexus gondwanensis]|uniref:aspartate/glutamate racemase family protein n=1 Tax=Psychroflexus gondwanensis TaxID=251 RepID=UPI0011BFE51D|nr:amino acid racemase [Psychroflexus gondwanensis]TXE16230.1 amino acid racemase [Psychroflexus gondwanensis]